MNIPWTLRMLFLLWPVVLLASYYILRRFRTALHAIIGRPLPTLQRLISMVWFWLNSYPITMLMLYLSGKYTTDYLVEGKWPWIDVLFTYPFVIGFLITVIALPYFLLVHLVEKVGKNRLSPRHRQLINGFQVGLLGFLFIWVPWKSYHDTQSVRVRTHTIQLEGKGRVFKNFPILLTADIQADRFTTQKELHSVVTIADTMDYQLALFAGDAITYSPHHLKPALNALCRMPRHAPAVACMGDHDFWFAPQAVLQQLQQCGWTFLKNRHHLVKWKNKLILVTGITNIYSQQISPQYLERLLDMAPPAQLKILLVHQPKQWIADLAEKYEYHLMVAGHTHGGQVAIPLFGWSFTPTMLENGYYSGQYQHGNLQVVVTNGVGLTFIPVRFGAPAEVTRILINPSDE